MARDCPDRQRGASWRNDNPMGRPGAPRLGGGGGGDAVDREYEVCQRSIKIARDYCSKLTMIAATYARTRRHRCCSGTH